MVNCPYLKFVKEVRRFLGLVRYYKRFVKNYGIMAQPIIALLEGNSFVWNYEAKAIWDNLKQAKVTALILAISNFNSTFLVESDATNIGIGAVLSQKGRPFTFSTRLYHQNIKSNLFMRKKC